MLLVEGYVGGVWLGFVV